MAGYESDNSGTADDDGASQSPLKSPSAGMGSDHPAEEHDSMHYLNTGPAAPAHHHPTGPVRRRPQPAAVTGAPPPSISSPGHTSSHSHSHSHHHHPHHHHPIPSSSATTTGTATYIDSHAKGIDQKETEENHHENDHHHFSHDLAQDPAAISRVAIQKQNNPGGSANPSNGSLESAFSFISNNFARLVKDDHLKIQLSDSAILLPGACRPLRSRGTSPSKRDDSLAIKPVVPSNATGGLLQKGSNIDSTHSHREEADFSRTDEDSESSSDSSSDSDNENDGNDREANGSGAGGSSGGMATGEIPHKFNANESSSLQVQSKSISSSPSSSSSSKSKSSHLNLDSNGSLLIHVISTLFRLQSPVFESLYQSALRDGQKHHGKLVIPVSEHILAETFLWIESYVYGLKPSLDGHSKLNICNLLYTAHYFGMGPLETACLARIRSKIESSGESIDEIISILRELQNTVKLFDDDSVSDDPSTSQLKKACHDMIGSSRMFSGEKGIQVLKSDSFLTLPEMMVIQLIERDDLFVPEDLIWRRCYEWCQKQAPLEMINQVELLAMSENSFENENRLLNDASGGAEKKHKEDGQEDGSLDIKNDPDSGGQSRRANSIPSSSAFFGSHDGIQSIIVKKMRKLSKNIRFNRMSLAFLSSEVAKSDVFSAKELLQLIQYTINPDESLFRKKGSGSLSKIWNESASHPRVAQMDPVVFDQFYNECLKIDGNLMRIETNTSVMLASSTGWSQGFHSWTIKLAKSASKKCRAIGIISDYSAVFQKQIYMCRKEVAFHAYCVEITAKHDFRVRENVQGRSELMFSSKTQDFSHIRYGDAVLVKLDCDQNTLQFVVQKPDGQSFPIPSVRIQSGLTYYPCIDCDGGPHNFIINPTPEQMSQEG